jgi:hypothetical protein
MAQTDIPKFTVARLWGAAAGRCQFRGCPKEIWRDDLTWSVMNKAHIAHIVADSPDGVRGDPIQSPKLAKDFGNLMLLCQDCHSRIDDIQRGAIDFPETLLLEYKREHEERVRLVTSDAVNQKTHWLFFSARIGDRINQIDLQNAKAALLEAGYFPAREQPWVIDTSSIDLRDNEPGYFEAQAANLQKQMRLIMEQELVDASCKRLAVFAIAPMPLLALLGRVRGQMNETVVFQKSTSDQTWTAHTGLGATDFEVIKEEALSNCAVVAVSISISGQIDSAAIKNAVGEDFHHYSLSSSPQTPAAIKTKGDRQRFGMAFLDLLSRIGQEHPGVNEIRVFPAMPVSAAVELGLQKRPNGHPNLKFFNRRADGQWYYSLDV